MKFMLAGGGNWYANWNKVERAAIDADRLGFWGFVLPDHYMWGPRMGGNSTLDTWIALTYLASRTERIRLGTLVTPIPFRPPSILAKIVSTLDVLSHGRTILGVGAGWSQTEFEGYSQWDTPGVRVAKTEEGLNLILRLWTEKMVTFEGKFYHSNGAVLEPKPVQRPHPPLLFGGIGPRMLRMAGRYADMCLIPAFPGVDNAKARKIVNDEAQRQKRLEEVSSVDMMPFTVVQSKYDPNAYRKKIEDAQTAGSKFFIAPFPLETFPESMKDFAENVMPSF